MLHIMENFGEASPVGSGLGRFSTATLYTIDREQARAFIAGWAFDRNLAVRDLFAARCCFLSYAIIDKVSKRL